jgi:hypothetical protein
MVTNSHETCVCNVRYTTTIIEPRHDKTNILGLRPAWIQTSLHIHAVWSGSMLFAISFSTCYGLVSEQHESWSDCLDAQAGLDPCWSQIHYVGFVMTQLICKESKHSLQQFWRYQLADKNLTKMWRQSRYRHQGEYNSSHYSRNSLTNN